MSENAQVNSNHQAVTFVDDRQQIRLHLAHQPLTPRSYPKYKAKPAAICGCIQIFLGLISITTNVMSIKVNASRADTGYAIWTPTCWILAGAFSIASAYYKSKCTITTAVVLYILSAMTVFYYLFLATQAFKEDRAKKHLICTKRIFTRSCAYYPTRIDPDHDEKMVLGIILIIVGAAEAVVSIAGLCLGCCVFCKPNTGDMEENNSRCVVQNNLNENTINTIGRIASPPSYEEVQEISLAGRSMSHPTSSLSPKLPEYSEAEGAPPPYKP